MLDHDTTTRPGWPMLVVLCIAILLPAVPADASRDLPDTVGPTLNGPVVGPSDLARTAQVRRELPFFSVADLGTFTGGRTHDYDDPSSRYCIYDGPDGLTSPTEGEGFVHPHLFQGLWTDPVTGIAYARNRWYDARTASWLSEDPMGDVDSPNLYAFVGWGPHVGRDPMGLQERYERWGYKRYSGETVDASYLFLVGKGIVPSGHSWHYYSADHPLLRLSVEGTSGRDPYSNAKYQIQGGGGTGFEESMSSLSHFPQILIGAPATSEGPEKNRMFQRLRLAQAVKMHSFLLEIYPETLELSGNQKYQFLPFGKPKDYGPYYGARPRAHNAASRFLLMRFADFDSPKEFQAEALSAIVSGIYTTESNKDTWASFPTIDGGVEQAWDKAGIERYLAEEFGMKMVSGEKYRRVKKFFHRTIGELSPIMVVPEDDEFFLLEAEYEELNRKHRELMKRVYGE